MAKDAGGHGSNGRGVAAAPAHQAGVGRLGRPLAPNIAATMKQNPNGFSINPTSGQQPQDGFMVAIHGKTQTMDPNDVTHQAVQAFVNANADSFSDSSMHVGGWKNDKDGKFYLDPSQHFTDRNQAIKAGRARNQIAIWDVKNKQEIDTGGTGE